MHLEPTSGTAEPGPRQIPAKAYHGGSSHTGTHPDIRSRSRMAGYQGPSSTMQSPTSLATSAAMAAQSRHPPKPIPVPMGKYSPPHLTPITPPISPTTESHMRSPRKAEKESGKQFERQMPPSPPQQESTSPGRTETAHDIAFPKTLRRPPSGPEGTPSHHVPLRSKTLRQPYPEPKSPSAKSPTGDKRFPIVPQPPPPSPQEQVPSPQRVKVVIPLSSKTMRRQPPEAQEPQGEGEKAPSPKPSRLSGMTLRRPREEKGEKEKKEKRGSIFAALLPSAWKPKAAAEPEEVPSEGPAGPQPTTQTHVETSQLPAVTHEHIKPSMHHIDNANIMREIHNHETIHRILPVKETQTLPTKHFAPSPDDPSKLVEIEPPAAPISGPMASHAICTKDTSAKAEAPKETIEQPMAPISADMANVMPTKEAKEGKEKKETKGAKEKETKEAKEAPISDEMASHGTCTKDVSARAEAPKESIKQPMAPISATMANITPTKDASTSADMPTQSIRYTKAKAKPPSPAERKPKGDEKRALVSQTTVTAPDGSVRTETVWRYKPTMEAAAHDEVEVAPGSAGVDWVKKAQAQRNDWPSPPRDGDMFVSTLQEAPAAREPPDSLNNDTTRYMQDEGAQAEWEQVPKPTPPAERAQRELPPHLREKGQEMRPESPLVKRFGRPGAAKPALELHPVLAETMPAQQEGEEESWKRPTKDLGVVIPAGVVSGGAAVMGPGKLTEDKEKEEAWSKAELAQMREQEREEMMAEKRLQEVEAREGQEAVDEMMAQKDAEKQREQAQEQEIQAQVRERLEGDPEAETKKRIEREAAVEAAQCRADADREHERDVRLQQERKEAQQMMQSREAGRVEGREESRAQAARGKNEEEERKKSLEESCKESVEEARADESRRRRELARCMKGEEARGELEKLVGVGRARGLEEDAFVTMREWPTESWAEEGTMAEGVASEVGAEAALAGNNVVLPAVMDPADVETTPKSGKKKKRTRKKKGKGKQT